MRFNPSATLYKGFVGATESDPNNVYKKNIDSGYQYRLKDKDCEVFDFTKNVDMSEYAVTVVRDSFSQPTNTRLTTFALRFPAAIAPELLRHRVFSFCSASTRAIPIKTYLNEGMHNPWIPAYFDKANKGMQPKEDNEILPYEIYQEFVDEVARRREFCDYLESKGLAKQYVNIWFQAHKYIEILISTTTLANFFILRLDQTAHREVRILAEMMIEAYYQSMPTIYRTEDLKEHLVATHLPFIPLSDFNHLVKVNQFENGDEEFTRKSDISVARCARISYKTFDGTKSEEKDLELASDLKNAQPVHIAPFEHVAVTCPGRFGNFSNWMQYRSLLEEFAPKHKLDYKGMEIG